MMSSRLSVVSGGGSGIGRAIALCLAGRGDEVIVLGRRPEPLTETAGLAKPEGGRIRPVVADLSEPDEVARVADEIATLDRPVDVLVNNAGGNQAPTAATDLAGIRRDWLANLTGNVLPTVLLTHALLPMLRRPEGRVVSISSVAALRGPASYGGAKAALHTWAVELATQLAPDRITVNVVAPGYVTDTDFYGDRMSPEFHRGRAERSPMKRGARPDEIASAVEWLANPDAGYITGQVLHVNGGTQLTGR